MGRLTCACVLVFTLGCGSAGYWTASAADLATTAVATSSECCREANPLLSWAGDPWAVVAVSAALKVAVWYALRDHPKALRWISGWYVSAALWNAAQIARGERRR